jgi:hypothetical protein
VHLGNTAYRIALNVRVSETLFFIIEINFFTLEDLALTSLAASCSPQARQVK